MSIEKSALGYSYARMYYRTYTERMSLALLAMLN